MPSVDGYDAQENMITRMYHHIGWWRTQDSDIVS